ncbi:MAG TPA: DUF1835 domain-containing protein [Gemmatimonadaceae bacterium]|nr:DUF1835 domain-containing protein [Gemmatimonadaceae bacterium]
MTHRLNITNGDSAAGKLSEAGIAGKIVSWRDVLHEGPVDASLPLSKLSEQRARFISDKGWDDFAHVSGSFRERDHAIQHLDYFDEVVLWFEDDLYDQLQLIQLLDFFATGGAARKRLSLIQVDGYIPPLSKAKLEELDSSRKEVTAEQLDIARRAWRAFGSSDPAQISAVLQQSTSALPYLASALKRHLEEFPSSTTGLSRSEREALTAIKSGHSSPVRAFLEVARMQESIFLGDVIFYSYLERLSDPDNPLLTWKNGSPVVAPRARDSREFVNAGELVVTPLGRQVLAGERDWQTLHRNTRWLGGVEIPPGPGGWRWNEREGTIMKFSPPKLKTAKQKSAKRKTAAKSATTTRRKPAKRKRK